MALAGENPEQAIYAGNASPQANLIVSGVESESPNTQQVLDNYSFDKKKLFFADNNDTHLDEEKAVEAEAKLVLAESNSDAGFIKDGLSALFVSGQASDTEQATEVAAEVPTQEATNPVLKAVNRQGANYFGVPRNGTPATYDADPLEIAVEWDLTDSATVGDTISSLSDFIGYQLITDDQTAMEVYSRKLPHIQQKIARITVDDAFQILSGRGLVTVFDHSYRTIKHIPR